MPNIVKMLISEEHNLSNPVNFAFETDGNGGTLGSGGKFYEKQYRYALDEQQVQRILDYAQEIDLVGKLEKGRGFVSRDYYVLTFDDGSNLTSTCGGYEMTEFLKQLKSELGEPVNKAELEKQAEELAKRAAPHDRSTWNCACGKMFLTGNFCSECGASRPPKVAEVEPWDCLCGMDGNTGKYCCNCGMPMENGKKS